MTFSFLALRVGEWRRLRYVCADGSVIFPRPWFCLKLIDYRLPVSEDSEVSTVYSVKFAMVTPPHPRSTSDHASEHVGDTDMSPENEAVLTVL